MAENYKHYTETDKSGHFHVDDRGMLHKCWHRCVGWGKMILAATFIELLLFWPTHQFFHAMGWL